MTEGKGGMTEGKGGMTEGMGSRLRGNDGHDGWEYSVRYYLLTS